ncbi:amino acid adenylation domain-containing protein [Bacillus paralicheniformis]|uniref:Amino acid adenylation domain-containing protein n=1 Tax=Bacillus paralicheniformis TaxID=1648923 RepID=A0AAW6KG63_9BACI|nr:non-ribosomal peptide synthetase [Bacillus paralicheniformis]MDE1453327.1 amino acid adenylation domain-containing protein [Bacillus paralicheniformis]
MTKKHEIQDIYPLSYMQEGMLFHTLLNKDTQAYVEQASFSMTGKVDTDIFQKSITALCARHDIFRTIFISQNVSVPQQVVLKERTITVEEKDLTHLDRSGQLRLIDDVKKTDRAKGFHLQKDGLMRVILFKTGEREFTCIWSFHHIIMDGWCLGIVLKEFFHIYASHLHQTPLKLEPAVPYGSYIQWLMEQDKEAAARYWEGYLEGYDQQSRLPQQKKAGAKSRQEEVTFSLSKTVTDKLKELAAKEEVTLSTIFHTLWGMLLQAYNQTDDAVFGSVISGRPAEIAGIERMIGLFINTVPVRVTGTKVPFVKLIKQVQKDALNGQPYSYHPLYEIQAESAVKQGLIDHILVFENYPVEKEIALLNSGQDAEDLFRIHDFNMEDETNYSFYLMVAPGENIHLKMRFDSGIHERSFIESVKGHLQHIIAQVLENPNLTPEELTITTQQEQKDLLSTLKIETKQREYETIQSMFERQAAQSPDEKAIHYEGQSITYKELNEMANKLARLLRKRGVKRQEPVAIMVERSPALAAGVLGILKAGAAFVPIDLSHPAERIRYCIENSGCQHIVSQHHVAALAKSAATKRSVTFIEEADAESDGSNVETVNTAEDLLYIMYTSGTTGKPKGVLFEHRNMANLLHDQFENSRIDFKTNVLQYASCAFDVCYQELFTTLLSGGTLCITPESIKRDPAQLFLLINTQRTEVVFFPTAFVKMLFNEEHYANHFPNCVKHVITAGEQLTVSHIFKALLKRHGIHLHNHYGPAETHVVSTCTIHPEGDIPDSPPIGKPISHNAMYILDKYKRLQPCGVAGELYISGASVGRGYVNNPILTKQKFLPDPFRAGAVMYRTGDIARLRADGQMDYIGRTDDQVKIRGYRVEPKEIEVTLANHPAVKEAVVLVQKDSEGEHELCAYYSTRKPIDPSALRHDLADAIPDYMMPVKWTAVPAIPLTANGKVDKSALPEPTSSASHQSYAAPRNLNELRLSQLWEGLLKRGPVGIRDNFFELGGHSLKATSLISRIAKEWNVQIPLSDVFAHPTVEGLAAVISETEENPFASIQQIEKKESYPVSSAQKRMYVLHQLDGGGVSYNIPAVLELTGELDQQRVEAVFRELIRRHEPLRTSFEAGDDGEPVQRIHEKVPFAFSNESSSESFIRPFDLGKAPLFRAGLATIEKGRYLLLVDMHHIISDGVSIQLLMQEFSELYKGLELAPLRIQYKDYAAWQETFKTSDIYKRQESYWLKQLAGELPVLELPTDKPRPPAKSFAGDRVTFEISQELTSRLQQLAGENSCTLYMTLLGIYTVLLSRLSGQEEIIVGSPIAGRPHADLESVLGMFVNTLAFRTRPVSGISFKQYLQDIRETALEAYEHQDYPLEKLVDRLGVQREMSRNPLFDTTFALQNMERQQLSMEGLELRQKDISHPISKFDLSLYMAESGGQIYCQFEYSTDLFERKTIQKWADFFKTLAKNAAQHPELELDHLSILSKKEESALLQNFSPMQKIDFPLDQPLHHQLEQQAEKTPDRPAVLADGVSISYRELNERANQIAWKLIGLGIQQEDVIAVMGRRSPDMLIGIYGILKAGAAYVPIDPDYPEERIRFLMKDSGAKTLLAESNPSMFEGTILPLDGGRGNHGEAAVNPNLPVPPDALAYIIYTSGSTGRPKGVMVEHRSAVNFLYSLQTRYSLNDSDIILHKTSYSFDASIWELFWWPFAGASVYLLPQGGEKDPEIILKALEEKEVTAAHFVPSMLHSFLEYMNQRKKPADIRHLKRVFAGGEQLGAHLVSRFHELLPRVELTNSYGPTEATVEAAYFDVPKRKTLDHVPIGRSGHNMRLYILNKKRQLLPFGCRGELYIAGAGVARGYLNRPELTEERFLDDPFYSGERMYQTGDLARWLPDGTVEWLGRMDGQVKIRGYRIEPGEVEAVLRQIDGVREAAVIARTEGEETELCAYIEGQDQQTVRTELGKRLPAYMMPSAFIEMREWPVTPSGKLDRKALPAPDGAAERRAYTAPQTITEMKLAKLWEEVLKYGPAGTRDHFFEQGGHSLKATALVSRIAKAFGVQVPLKEIFAKPTLEELAAVIQELDESPHAAIEPADKQDTYPVSSAQKRMYVLQQLEDGGVGYNMPAALKLTGPLDRARLDEVFRQLIRRHESLRTSFETGADGEPVQRIHDDVPFQLMELVAAEDFVRPFRLQEAPLFRAALVKEAEESHLLLVDMHHIISDGVSVGTLISEFSELYANRMLASLRIQYKDYAVWQQAFKQGEAYNRQEAYWLKQLDGELPVLELPADNARPAVRSFAGDTVSRTLDAKTTAGLYKIARDNGCTLYMVLLAAYSTLLARLSGQEDIIIGSPIAGRPHKDLEPVIGMFVNTLAIRTHPAENKCFSDFLREVRETALEAFEHQDYPFEELVDRLDVVRDMSRNPLFDAMFILQNMEQHDMQLAGLQVNRVQTFAHQVSIFDLTLTACESNGNIRLDMEFSTDLFLKTTIERWMKHLLVLLRHIAHQPETDLARFNLLNDEDQYQILVEFNHKHLQLPERTAVFHELFEETTANNPQKIAVIEGSKQISYHQLNGRANRLARTLQTAGIGPGKRVAILANRSIEAIIGVLAVLKAGGAYIPIDSHYPEERIRFLLKDSEASALLAQAEYIDIASLLTDGSMPCIQLDHEHNGLHEENIVSTATPKDTAYVIYTSGTTGAPKGVEVRHRNFTHAALAWRSIYELDRTPARVLQMASFSFDVFSGDIARAFLDGGTLVICPDDVRIEPELLCKLMNQQQITLMESTPALIVPFMEYVYRRKYRLPSLKVLILGSDIVSAQDFYTLNERFGKEMRIINSYGVTEATIDSSYYEITMSKERYHDFVPIGIPLPNVQMYVLNKNKQVQPIGVPGELFIGGEGVAKGYWRKADLTKAKFSDPLAQGRPLYQTGDQACWLPDGTLRLYGRLDQQVKIKGYRIELEEIENALLKNEHVKEAAVAIQKDIEEKTYLAAYVVPKEADIIDLRLDLAKRLPAYMIPAHFVGLEKMPLTFNGKLNKDALPAAHVQPLETYHAPQNEKQALLCRIWEDVLHVRQAGITDSFFQLGGDSIKALQVSARLAAEGWDMTIRDLFQFPTIEELASHLTPTVSIADQGPVEGNASLTPVQQRFFAYPGAFEHHYNQAVMLTSEKRLDETALRRAVSALIKHHDALRMMFKKDDNGRILQYNRGISQTDEDGFSFKTIDLADETQIAERIEAEEKRIQRAIRLDEGLLCHIGLFRLRDADHLLIAIHHLIVDGVSWRILLEDLQTAYQQALADRKIKLPQKSDSYVTYANRLHPLSTSNELLEEAAYWEHAISFETAALPKDGHRNADRLQKTALIASRMLSVKLTNQLLFQTKQAYGTEVNELMLAALGMALADWTKREHFLVSVEGHGREGHVPDIDISRTVGWFTSIYPVLLDMSVPDNSSEKTACRIKNVKDMMRRVPNQGTGYGLLQSSQRIQHREPEICFNYLGQFDGLEGMMRMSPYQPRHNIAEERPREFDLDINAMVVNQRLDIQTVYTDVFSRRTIETFMDGFHDRLCEVIEHCSAKKKREKTLSDFSNKQLTSASFESIANLVKKL